MKRIILTLGIAAVLPASYLAAQDPGGPRPPGPPPKDGGGGRRPGPRDGDNSGNGPRDGQQRPPGPMFMPLLKALDTDGDGIISADEIKNASDSLKKLDKNNDGQLTRDEYAPPPPPPPQGDGQRKGSPRDGGKASAGASDPSAKKADAVPWNRPEKWEGVGSLGALNGKISGDSTAGKDKDKSGSDDKGKKQPPPPPPSPLLDAIDTDHDGVISADEIGKAPESLLKLDKNNDGQLGPREYMPAPPDGQVPPPDGQRPKKGGKGDGKPAQ